MLKIENDFAGRTTMTLNKLALSFIAAGALVALLGCNINPTPKPIRTGSLEDREKFDVAHVTYETDVDTPRVVAPAVVTVERPVLPVVRPYEQWTEQEAAADALGRIGARAIPYLQQALRSPDPLVKKQAAEVLARMGSDAKPAVNDLIPLLDDPDPEIRKVAARTLGRIGPDAAAAVPALMRTLIQQETVVPPPVPEPNRLPVAP
jgi:hypothetical protein